MVQKLPLNEFSTEKRSMKIPGKNVVKRLSQKGNIMKERPFKEGL
jgi:hypothetical protein